MSGTVYLVGAGPGDPELLTLKAHRLLSSADVVLYDRLLDPNMLSLVKSGAVSVSVGKAPGGRGSSQNAIHRLMVEHAERGALVVRLKGGDPYLFGRGGEEGLALSAAGIPWHVVPGVSSALAAPALAGIPLTHRGVSSGVWIMTAHHIEKMEWESMAKTSSTLVLMMGMATLAQSVACLIANGRDERTPSAAVSKGSWQDQQVVRAPLADLVDAVHVAHLSQPCVIIIGDVTDVLSRGRDFSYPEAWDFTCQV